MKKVFITTAVILCLSTAIVCAFNNPEIAAQSATFKIILNGENKDFENPVVLINGRTYVSLREIAESFGMNVFWSDENKTVSVEYEKKDKNPHPFEVNRMWGYIDEDGKILSEPVYYSAEEFCEGLALVRTAGGQNGKYCYIDKTGKTVISDGFYDATSFSNGAARVNLTTHTDENFWTYIDRNGNRLFDKTFESCKNFSHGYAPVLKEGTIRPEPEGSKHNAPKWSYIDKNGNFVNEMEFDEAYSFNKNGYAMVKQDGKWGVIDTSFSFVIPCEFDDIDSDGYSLFRLFKNNKWTYISLAQDNGTQGDGSRPLKK